MVDTVRRLDPFRWKAFQVLYVEGKNDADEKDLRMSKRKRNAKKLLISDAQFEAFCDRHKELACIVPEPNSVMAASYLLVDEFFCFLDKGGGVEKQSRSILEVGVETALSEVRWDKKAFGERGGVYDWTKDADEVLGDGDGDAEGGCGPAGKESLDW
ncbi:Uu.00g075850.m01.CDS01 [Anthostomella pinea]|uniref:Uu.00g075850.m01.CDS01 n=1 Tax=Anthostomella pinea TaxID=933095 RepID=A0AAI8YP81_9PEZI|nr:Uu.00g075850.m01.CDS01 [Anthostomella pinea]